MSVCIHFVRRWLCTSAVSYFVFDVIYVDHNKLSESWFGCKKKGHHSFRTFPHLHEFIVFTIGLPLFVISWVCSLLLLLSDMRVCLLFLSNSIVPLCVGYSSTHSIQQQFECSLLQQRQQQQKKNFVIFIVISISLCILSVVVIFFAFAPSTTECSKQDRGEDTIRYFPGSM